MTHTKNSLPPLRGRLEQRQQAAGIQQHQPLSEQPSAQRSCTPDGAASEALSSSQAQGGRPCSWATRACVSVMPRLVMREWQYKASADAV